VTVGNNEDPVSEVRGTKGGRWYALPLRIVPEGGQVPEYSCKESTSVDSKETWDVLHENEAGSKEAKNSSVLRPEPPFVGGASMLAGLTDGLTWETSANKVNWCKVPSSTGPGIPRTLRKSSFPSCPRRCPPDVRAARFF
jgi:hypothetical protein